MMENKDDKVTPRTVALEWEYYRQWCCEQFGVDADGPMWHCLRGVAYAFIYRDDPDALARDAPWVAAGGPMALVCPRRPRPSIHDIATLVLFITSRAPFTVYPKAGASLACLLRDPRLASVLKIEDGARVRSLVTGIVHTIPGLTPEPIVVPVRPTPRTGLSAMELVD